MSDYMVQSLKLYYSFYQGTAASSDLNINYTQTFLSVDMFSLCCEKVDVLKRDIVLLARNDSVPICPCDAYALVKSKCS